jgi:hypothetical protein
MGKKPATPVKNSVAMGRWHKEAKVTAIKQQKIKVDRQREHVVETT